MDIITPLDENNACKVVDQAVEVWKRARVVYQSPSSRHGIEVYPTQHGT
jgi:hypothetical protein